MVREKAKILDTVNSKQPNQSEFLYKTMDDALHSTDLEMSNGIFDSTN
jgi:hypothetical protein